MVQSLLYIFFIVYDTVLIVTNIIFIFTKEVDNALLPSVVSESRANFAIVSAVVIPTGWASPTSFSTSTSSLTMVSSVIQNMRFKYEEYNKYGMYKKYEIIGGVWEDLN